MPHYPMITLTEIVEERPSKYNKSYDYQLRFNVYAPDVFQLTQLHYTSPYTDYRCNFFYNILEKLKECMVVVPYSAASVTALTTSLETNKDSFTNGVIYRLRNFLLPRFRTIDVVDVNNLDERIALLKNEVKFLQELYDLRKCTLVSYSKSNNGSLVKLSFKEADKKYVMEFMTNLVEEYSVLLPHLVPSLKLYKANAYGEKGVVYLKGNTNKFRLYINCSSRKWTLTDLETIMTLPQVCPSVTIGWGLLWCCNHKEPRWLRETHYVDVKTREDYDYAMLIAGELFNKKRTVGTLK